ncbi:9020_t:CDS:2, partial [Entrophospora sp. SA101]
MDYNFIQKLFQAVSSREGSHAPQRTSDESLNTVPGETKAKVIIDSNLSNDGINLAQTINKKCEFIEYNDNDDDSCVVECNNDIDLAQTINKKHKFI